MVGDMHSSKESKVFLSFFFFPLTQYIFVGKVVLIVDLSKLNFWTGPVKCERIIVEY